MTSPFLGDGSDLIGVILLSHSDPKLRHPNVVFAYPPSIITTVGTDSGSYFITSLRRSSHSQYYSTDDIKPLEEGLKKTQSHLAFSSDLPRSIVPLHYQILGYGIHELAMMLSPILTQKSHKVMIGDFSLVPAKHHKSLIFVLLEVGACPLIRSSAMVDDLIKYIIEAKIRLDLSQDEILHLCDRFALVKELVDLFNSSSSPPKPKLYSKIKPFNAILLLLEPREIIKRISRNLNDLEKQFLHACSITKRHLCCNVQCKGIRN